MNEAVTFRLFLAREMLRRGVGQATSRLPIDRMGAVLDLDHGIDMLLQIVVPMVGKQVADRDTVNTLLPKLTEVKSEFEPQAQALGRLHRLRNRVQHDGVVPSAEDTRAMAVDAEAAFRAIGEQVIGREVFERGAASLVRDEEVRTHLVNAEDGLAAGDVQKTCIDAAAAFELAKGRLISVVFPERRRVWEGILSEVGKHIGKGAHEAIESASRQPVSSELAEFVSRFRRRLTSTSGMGFDDPLAALYEPMALADASIDLDELRRFRAVVPIIHFGGGGSHQAVFRSVPDLDGARFAVDFATRAVLRLEAAVSRLAGTTENSEKQSGTQEPT